MKCTALFQNISERLMGIGDFSWMVSPGYQMQREIFLPWSGSEASSKGLKLRAPVRSPCRSGAAVSLRTRALVAAGAAEARRPRVDPAAQHAEEQATAEAVEGVRTVAAEVRPRHTPKDPKARSPLKYCLL